MVYDYKRERTVANGPGHTSDGGQHDRNRPGLLLDSRARGPLLGKG